MAHQIPALCISFLFISSSLFIAVKKFSDVTKAPKQLILGTMMLYCFSLTYLNKPVLQRNVALPEKNPKYKKVSQSFFVAINWDWISLTTTVKLYQFISYSPGNWSIQVQISGLAYTMGFIICPRPHFLLSLQ